MVTGIIIANTGSPSAPEPDAIELYLREFLMDDRIRQLPKPLWKYIVFRHILPKRKFSSADRYRFVWTPAGSPVIVNQQALCDKVQALFDEQCDGANGEAADRAIVRNAMSYGEPSIVHALKDLEDAGVDRVILLPLYPQSAYSPTQAVIDSFKRARTAIGWSKPSQIIDNYHDNPLYISAIAQAVRSTGYDPARGDKLLLSLHAIPLKDERAGDTYRAQIAESAALLAAELGISVDDITISFQSVFGHNKDAWTAPLTTDILQGWRNGDFRVAFACPGFAIDCLETLYDIPFDMVPALEGEASTPVVGTAENSVEHVINSNGRFLWVPCLNASDEHAAVVKNVLDEAFQTGAFAD